MRASSTLCATLVLLSCAVDYRADQGEYDRRRCARKMGGCVDGGAVAVADAAADGAGATGGGGVMTGGAAGMGGGGGGAGGLETGGAGGATDGGGIDGASSCGSGEVRCVAGVAGLCTDGAWVDTPCPLSTPECENDACVECVNASGRCNGGAPELCTSNAWQAQAACSADSFCQGGLCGTPPSCTGLLSTCGSSGTASCCQSLLVPGGGFHRNNDPTLPVTVSDFLLDEFEITVGRFREFLAAYPADTPNPGDGAHPRIRGSGWDPTWNTQLPLTSGLLAAALKCNAYATWTDAPSVNENKPINCLTWYAAFAFCAWDGGRLPTDNEFNYAATGGADQRLYPWGDTAPGYDALTAVYDCYYNGAGSSCSSYVGNIAPVGSAPAGNGKWGHADLAGNIEEWNLDASAGQMPVPCHDCAVLGASGTRVARGGYFSAFAANLLNSARDVQSATSYGSTTGMRCARTP